MAEPPPKKTTIAIIGAGIAGPFFALTILSHPLLSQLYKPVIYERLPEEREAGGAAVALTSNALSPLYELGLKDALNAISCETQRILISRSFPSSPSPQSQEQDRPAPQLNQILHPNWHSDLSTCLRVVERAALQSLLLDRVRELGGEVVWERSLRWVERVDDGEGVKMLFQGGIEERAGLVIGADGGWSFVRRLIVASKATPTKSWSPAFAGADAIYGVSRRMERSGDRVGEGEEQMEGDTHWVFLNGGMGSTWALREGKVFWTLTFFTKTPPERKSAAATRRGEGEGESNLYGASVSLGGYSLEETQKVLEKYENAWHPTAGTFGNLLRNSERIVRTPLYSRAWEAEEIVGENMVLIGDASRLMLPTSGQGACFAIEDATVLANALLNNPPSSQTGELDFSAAISAYTSARIPRSKSMTKQSYWTGVVMSWVDTWWLRWFVDLSTTWLPSGDPKLSKEKPKDPMGWIYDQRYKVELRGEDGSSDG
ncbi:FAD/NAD(P)-binding domain-containing protein [Hyaloscypha bicolor E]|uniref:FAD/NAD(P)-binding domain-containing protein n=1 Tax=Hyaloscypha bicolor E TaxID=1095630 RepID=A0A2J6TH49_9HELO|nr:FAD/NAD(P)-binding domain-containing protein [Hyaloscypha bicolor E]PMD62359.1 FAD/NAD(P)-binding domain-containing protein [Hyaloscypha bicolor E]